MKAPAFEYTRPSTLDAALAALRESESDGHILAGGQSLLPILNFRLAHPAILIDIGGLDPLREIRDEQDCTTFGCLVTHARIEDGGGGKNWHGMLEYVARDIAYRAVRNRGTIGGSIAHADPAADWPVALMALNAEIEIAGPGLRRTVSCETFFSGLFATALARDEMVVAIKIPKLSNSARWSYIKVRRKAGAFADALAAIVIDRARDSARVVIGGSATGACRLPQVEGELRSENRAGAGEAICADLQSRTSGFDDYQRHIQLAAVKRALGCVLT
jgi:aerobic carbon-monoxide dehydrogenase medium subunit